MAQRNGHNKQQGQPSGQTGTTTGQSSNFGTTGAQGGSSNFGSSGQSSGFGSSGFGNEHSEKEQGGGTATHTLGDLASTAVETAREQAKAGATALGTGMRNLAGALRQSGPHEGLMGTAATNIADTLERSGHYLEEEGLNAIGDDITRMIRRNPLPAVCVAAGLGFLVAHMCRSQR